MRLIHEFFLTYSDWLMNSSYHNVTDLWILPIIMRLIHEIFFYNVTDSWTVLLQSDWFMKYSSTMWLIHELCVLYRWDRASRVSIRWQLPELTEWGRQSGELFLTLDSLNRYSHGNRCTNSLTQNLNLSSKLVLE